MYLSVVLSRLLLEEEISSSQRFQISRNAEGVGAMRLGQAKSNALVLRQIAVGVLDRQFRYVLRTRSSSVQRMMPMKASALND